MSNYSTEDEASYTVELRRHLKAILNRTIALQLTAGLVSFVALGAWVYLGATLWTAVSNEPALWKTLLVSRGFFIVAGILFIYFVVWPLVRLPRLDALATEVEKRKDFKELLRAGFEFSTDSAASKKYSPELVREVIRRAVQSIAGLQVRFLFLNQKDLALVPVAYGGLAVLLVLALAQPALIVNTGRLLSAPTEAAAVEHRANIHATPGNVTVLAGSDVEVAGLDFGRTQEEVTISYNLSEDFWKTEPTTLRTAEEASAGASAIDRYEYTFSDLRYTVSYYFESGEYKSDVYTITVVHKPMLTDLDITLTPPSYTGEKPLKFKDNGGNVQALEGTHVAVAGFANNQLADAWVQFDGKNKRQVAHDGRKVSFDFRALEDGYYSVILEDTLGHKTDDPLVYAIEVFKDQAPSLDVIEPGGDAGLPRNQKLNVGFIAADDYGVQRAHIYYRKNDEREFQRIAVPLGPQRNNKEVAAAYEWNLKKLSLFPGHYVEYFVQVADNNVVTGPGIAKSRIFRVTVPTMADLYDKTKEEDARRGDLFEQAIEESEEFRERLEKITREFIKTEKMEWSQKKEVDKALDTQKAVEEKLDQIKNSMDQTLQELSDNQMTSQQIGEKLEEIRDLLEQINNDELKNYIEQLNKSIEKLSPEDIKEALENINLSAEDMLEKLKRTAELLKQIQKEQDMEELVRKSQDLLQEQKELGDETADAQASDKKTMDELADKQGDLANKTDQLKESIDEVAAEMSESDQDAYQQLQQASQQLEKQQGPQKNMKEASRQLQQGQKQGAQQEQQKATDKLISLFQMASAAQQSMQQNSGKKMAANLQKFAEQTLELSFKQEALTKHLQGQRISDESADLQELAQDQNSYLKATEKVADELVKLSQKSLRISPQLMEALGKSLERMQNSLLFLEQDKPFMAVAHSTNAIESLNQATIEMLRTAKECSSCQSGGGQSMAQRLMQQLIPQQQDVLGQTRSMLEMQALREQLREEQEERLRRVAAQQRSLKELAEEIQRSLKKNEDILGRLDRTIDDMEAVARGLERGELDENLFNKQQRILSRLLDAQRSIHTRDYEKERRSVTAEDIFSKSLGVNPKKAASHSLREEIRRAMQLKAPGEFEDLIKLYFRALAEESSIQNEPRSN